MSNNTKIWTVVVILVILVGGWMWYNQSRSSTPRGSIPTKAPVASVSMGSPSDNSNAAIDQDLAAIDSQLSGLSTDATDLNNSLSTSSMSGL